ncbi:MAG: ABC transporter substrate-binding protein, partial [Geminicoccaceae bacterium]
MNKRFGRTLLALGVGMALVAPGSGVAQESAAEPTKLTFMFPVESVVQYHPFYIAQELGYFAEEGLEVEFQVADGSSAAIQQLVAGNADAALPSPGA